jgi:hypothetical protein
MDGAVTPFHLLAQVAAAGARLRPLPDGRLQMNAPRPLPELLVEQLRAHKAELLAALRLPIPEAWLGGVARLRAMPVPVGVPDHWWRRVLWDADAFGPWAGQAAALGWSTLDVFGVLPVKPVERVDAWGLLPALGGAELVALTKSTARLRRPTGALQSFPRRERPGTVPIWQLP